MWLVLVDNKLADEIPAKKEKRKPSNTAKKTRIFRSQKYKRRMSHKSFPKNAEEKNGTRCHSNKEPRARILSIVNNINNRICFLIDKKKASLTAIAPFFGLKTSPTRLCGKQAI